MKKIISIGAAVLFSINSALAVDLGALDTTFSNEGSSDGWDLSGEMGYHRYGGDVAVDSQGRIYVVGTYDFDFQGQTEKGARIERRLPNGSLDTSFDNDGIRELGLPPAPGNQFEYELQVDSSDGVFIGYSRLYCVTNNDCESDIYVYHINTNGFIVGSQQVDFDLGSTNDRRDDDFADMIYIQSLNKLAITAEVELGTADDTDFGIAVLNVNPTSGALSMDTGFSSDGKAKCYFDHADPSGSEDQPEAIVYDYLSNTLIVGGSSFEDNGFGGGGWNMSFCEFDLQGNLVRDWSTESLPEVVDDREFVKDMKFVNINNQSHIVVAGMLPGAGGLDFALTRYSLSQLGNWVMDTSFGSQGNGWEKTAFEFIFVGDTNDIPAEMLIEEDGAILVAGTISWEDSNMLPHGATALARYTPNGHLDTNWGIGKSGKAVHPFDLTNIWGAAEGLAINRDTEEIYITGFIYDGADWQSLVANMHNDLLFGSNFDF